MRLHTCSAFLALALPAAIFWGSSPTRAPRDFAPASSPRSSQTGWTVYGGQAADDHYSALTQIDRSNVRKLRVAWTFDTGESGALETSPLIVGGALYAYTPSQKVIALNAATGKPLWTFDSGVIGRQPVRGLAYWSGSGGPRLFAAVMSFLYALDPATGRPIESFGEGGRIDLRKGLGGDYRRQSIALTTPGIVYKDLIIVGGREPETHPAPPGDIRAYDVRTGALRWTFHTIPRPGELGYDTWPKNAWKAAGSANNWTGMALDAMRGIVYVPTGSAVSDFYGGDRIGNDLFSDCLLALDAETGKLLWFFQGVHHDIWDRDFPSPPSLVTVFRNGRPVDTVAQTTKQGYLYLFDRVTGKPLFPIVEVPVPPSSVPGEIASPTQPKPLAPAPYGREELTAGMLTERTPEAHAFALKEFKTFLGGQPFVPFTENRQTIVFPGFDGGAEWGGSAVDPAAGVIYFNSNQMAWTGGLVESRAGTPGEMAYRRFCAACHGQNRQGSPPAFPSLIGIEKGMPAEKIKDTIHDGVGRMPAFPMIDEKTIRALLDYLKTAGDSPDGKREMLAPSSVGATDQARWEAAGAESYSQHCSSCHGDDREGIPPYSPSLIGIGGRMSRAQIVKRIRQGKGRMPGFPKLQDGELDDLLRFLGADLGAGSRSGGNDVARPSARAATTRSYDFTGYNRFVDQDGYPAIAPPWGTLDAIDLNTGQYLWKIPFGEYPELIAKGMKDTGSSNYGGPILTRSGILFIGATCFDKTMHAYDSKTGKLLWKAALPYAGVATPATYMVNGRQYVVIAAAGGRDGLPARGEYVAFALPLHSRRHRQAGRQ